MIEWLIGYKDDILTITVLIPLHDPAKYKMVFFDLMKYRIIKVDLINYPTPFTFSEMLGAPLCQEACPKFGHSALSSEF